MTYEYMGGLGLISSRAEEMMEVLNARVYAVQTATSQGAFQDRVGRLRAGISDGNALRDEGTWFEDDPEWVSFVSALQNAEQYLSHVIEGGFASRSYGLQAAPVVTTTPPTPSAQPETPPPATPPPAERPPASDKGGSGGGGSSINAPLIVGVVVGALSLGAGAYFFITRRA